MIGAVWSVRWTNPYTQPPDNRPRVLIEVYRPEGHPEVRGLKPPAAIQQALDQVGLGSGYSLHWQPISAPPVIKPPDKLAVIRRKRLERRIRKKYPLFADEFIAQELARRSAYYDGITDPRLAAARDEVIAKEAEKLAELIQAYENEVADELAA